jgi:hypothetical protein
MDVMNQPQHHVLIKDMFIMVLSQWKNAESQQLCMQY